MRAFVESFASALELSDCGQIALDPCTEAWNPTFAAKCFTREENGLEQPWLLRHDAVAWVNPPYSRGQVSRWVTKIAHESLLHEQGKVPVHVLLLVQADATAGWHKNATGLASALCRVAKRIPFIDPNTGKTATGARFSSDLFYFGGRPHLFADVMRDLGRVEVLR